MDPACPAKSWTPSFFPFPHHHHHHHHHHHGHHHHHHHGHHCRQLFVCPHNRLHRHHQHQHRHRHRHVCPNFPREPSVSRAVPNDVVVNAETSQYPEPPNSAPQLLFEEEEEEEDEPVFVLTDVWRDFFAKSEAKRKLEKKLAKGKKH